MIVFQIHFLSTNIQYLDNRVYCNCGEILTIIDLAQLCAISTGATKQHFACSRRLGRYEEVIAFYRIFSRFDIADSQQCFATCQWRISLTVNNIHSWGACAKFRLGLYRTHWLRFKTCWILFQSVSHGPPFVPEKPHQSSINVWVWTQHIRAKDYSRFWPNTIRVELF